MIGWACYVRTKSVVNPPTPCHFGKHPTSTRKKTAGHRGARGGGYVGKAPDVDFFTWLPVGVKSNKSARGSVSLI